MNKIIVTPAGRKRYLEVLYLNLLKCKDEFDKWVIWVNSDNIDDINYMISLSENNDFIELQHCDIPVDPNGSHTSTICTFFRKCIDEDSVYLRLDDDVVYIHKGSIKDLFEFRINNDEYFLVFGNILNNAIISHLYQNQDIIPKYPSVSYDCLDYYGWNDPNFALNLHNIFFQKYQDNKITEFFIKDHILSNFDRCSINAISWTGRSFKSFDGIVGPAEEIWLSNTKPMEINKPCVIFGNSLFSHYAFSPQRDLIDKTETLSKYLKISTEYNLL
jgi:hypothetical protein